MTYFEWREAKKYSKQPLCFFVFAIQITISGWSFTICYNMQCAIQKSPKLDGNWNWGCKPSLKSRCSFWATERWMVTTLSDLLRCRRDLIRGPIKLSCHTKTTHATVPSGDSARAVQSQWRHMKMIGAKGRAEMSGGIKLQQRGKEKPASNFSYMFMKIWTPYFTCYSL